MMRPPTNGRFVNRPCGATSNNTVGADVLAAARSTRGSDGPRTVIHYRGMSLRYLGAPSIGTGDPSPTMKITV